MNFNIFGTRLMIIYRKRNINISTLQKKSVDVCIFTAVEVEKYQYLGTSPQQEMGLDLCTYMLWCVG